MPIWHKNKTIILKLEIYNLFQLYHGKISYLVCVMFICVADI